jgi:exodeoxyribonuclease VII large subunit
MPENDMNVIVRARVSVYEAAGEYQIYVDDMQPDGTGALALAFEQLKMKLAAEGLFDDSHKKSIPEFPERVGVVTSESGAAFRDICNIISRRFPFAEIVLCPVAVQGAMASGQIAEAINRFNELKGADVLIVGRGGGSAEDLWAFNEEPVVRAIYESEIPVISAVGHETDVTLCDWAADLRAPTPSAAAELAVPDSGVLADRIYSYFQYIENCVFIYIEKMSERIDNYEKLLEAHKPSLYVENLMLKLDSLSERLNVSVNTLLTDKFNALKLMSSKLDMQSPLKILARGYSVVSKDGLTVSDSSSLSKGDKINIKFNKGDADCEVL